MEGCAECWRRGRWACALAGLVRNGFQGRRRQGSGSVTSASAISDDDRHRTMCRTACHGCTGPARPSAKGARSSGSATSCTTAANHQPGAGRAGASTQRRRPSDVTAELNLRHRADNHAQQAYVQSVSPRRRRTQRTTAHSAGLSLRPKLVTQMTRATCCAGLSNMCGTVLGKRKLSPASRICASLSSHRRKRPDST
jgi:hypothetical protein